MTEYDECSDVDYKKNDRLFLVYPASDKSIELVREFIAKHALTQEDVKIIKTKDKVKLVAKRDVVLTFLSDDRSEM